MRTTIATVGVLGLAVALAGWAVTAQSRKQAQKKDEKQQTQICTLKVAGMTCGGCEAAVKMAAKKVGGVKDVKASYEKGTAEITYDPTRTNPEAIADAITKNSGFRAEAPKKDNKQ